MKKLALALVLTLSACATPGEAPESTTDAPPTTAAGSGEPTVLLEVRDEGGFVPVEFSIGRMPRYVLMTDGTLYGPGMMTLEFPSKLLQAVSVVTIGESDMANIVQYIEDIGFADIIEERDDSAMVNVADAPDTVVTYFDDEGAHVFSVYALGIAPNPGDVRVALLNELVQALDSANTAGTPAGTLEPERIEVLAGIREIPVDPQFENERPWPIEVSFADMAEAGAGWRCATLEGEAKDQAMAIFAEANSASSWNDGTNVYSIVVRYLYPHQEGC